MTLLQFYICTVVSFARYLRLCSNRVLSAISKHRRWWGLQSRRSWRYVCSTAERTPNIHASLWRCVETGYIVTHHISCCFADCARISCRLRGRTWTPVWISTFSQRANEFHLSRSVGLTLKWTTPSSSLHVYLSHGYELLKHHFPSTKRATGAVTSQY
jgi:hypothetical protein